jgi:hypothetical protein
VTMITALEPATVRVLDRKQHRQPLRWWARVARILRSALRWRPFLTRTAAVVRLRGAAG